MERLEDEWNSLYRPLPPHSLRLLRLNVDTSDSNAGSLEVVAFENAPPYYALSHSWGMKSLNTVVRIDGHVLAVAPDLAIGVQRLQELAAQNLDLNTPLRYIWIDNICINQNDISERSSQVNFMGKIYKQSLGTLIWLGPESGSCSAAWELVDHIYDVFKSQNSTAKTPDDIPIKFYSDIDHASSGLPPWDSQKWLNLKELLELRWFSRIWCVQEVILSSSDPVILLHGKRLYPWHRLGWVAAWMRRNGYIRLSQIPEELHNVDTMCNIQRTKPKWPLDALMSITHIKFHASDQRDKIYALLGLAAECEDTSSIPDPIRPDYTMDVTQVYQKVARFLLEQNRSLTMLTRAHATSGSLTRRQREQDLALPSWVPDWSDIRMVGEGRRISFSWIDYSDHSKTPRLGFPKHYNASAGLELDLHYTQDSSILRTSGIRMGEVVQTIPFNQKNCSTHEFRQILRSSLLQALDISIPLLIESDLYEWANHFIKSTTAEQHRLSGRDYDQSLRDGLAYLHDLLLADTHQMARFIANTHHDDPIDELQRLSSGGDPNKYAALAQNYCFNRSFLITSTGRMGIGPYDTHIEDTVAVILGGDVPYIIRAQEDSWEFVGEAYIQGFMAGEAIEAYQRGFQKREILDFQ